MFTQTGVNKNKSKTKSMSQRSHFFWCLIWTWTETQLTCTCVILCTVLLPHGWLMRQLHDFVGIPNKVDSWCRFVLEHWLCVVFRLAAAFSKTDTDTGTDNYYAHHPIILLCERKSKSFETWPYLALMEKSNITKRWLMF